MTGPHWGRAARRCKRPDSVYMGYVVMAYIGMDSYGPGCANSEGCGPRAMRVPSSPVASTAAAMVTSTSTFFAELVVSAGAFLRVCLTYYILVITAY